MSQVPTLYERARALLRPVRKAIDNPQNLFRMFIGGFWPTVSYDQTISARAAMLHPIVARCLNKLATSVQQVDWYVERIPADGATAEADPEKRRNTAEVERSIAAFLAHPHDTLSAADLRYWMTLNRATYGRFYFYVTRSTKGFPTGLYPLPTEKLSVVVDKKGIVTGYKMQTPGDGWVEYKTKAAVDAEDAAATAAGRSPAYSPFVFHISLPGLELSVDDLSSNSPLLSIGLPAAIIDELMRRAYDTAAGHPNSRYVVTTDANMTTTQEETYSDSLTGQKPGADGSGRVMVLSGLNMKVTKLDNDLSDIHSKMPTDDMARQIAGAFGIPIALIGLGAADGAKFAGNYDGSRLSFWEDTVIPSYLTPFAQAFTAALCPAGYRIAFKLDTIPALQSARIARMMDLATVVFLTNDERRSLVGFPPLRADQKLPTDNLTTPPKVDQPA